MRGFSSLALIGILFLGACGSKKSTSQEKAVPSSAVPQSKIKMQDLEPYEIQGDVAIACMELEKASEHSDSNLRMVVIQDLKNFDGCLVVQFQYSGCSSTEAHLRWISTDTNNHQLALYVDNPGDCEMLIEERWHFDLQVLGPNPNDMILEFKNDFSADFSAN
ncbi:hypothetical protein [Croceimicrobium hydrocarbonivorans]|uniref:Lipoprotein n=1 Tax=Croceimicrobium hydrocarbonivorans TaxID=2761580 RepID=A0A7H0VFH8_9FLAO|nr:hypothetical protein [Croceimicrobium hydrocarbonivorans]QNR24476.1 hypothetical protein H4K34_01135 [Croceimicrobium hydrocarbonivorans]